MRSLGREGISLQNDYLLLNRVKFIVMISFVSTGLKDDIINDRISLKSEANL